jgi:hypothetical protein
MLETIREFGLEMLRAAGEAGAAHLRHADYFAMLAESAASPSTLEHEHDNLRAALQWSLAHSNHALAARIAGALWPYWLERGHLSEGRRWLGSVLEGGATAKVYTGAARLLNRLGVFGLSGRMRSWIASQCVSRPVVPDGCGESQGALRERTNTPVMVRKVERLVLRRP